MTGHEDRYEPMPGLLSLPGFLVRKLGPRGRVAAAVLGALAAAGLIVAAVLLVPVITDVKRDNAEHAEREADRARAAERRALLRAQRPQTALATPAPAIAAIDRRDVVGQLERAIVSDVERRVAAGALRPPVAMYTSCATLRNTADALVGAGPRFGRLTCTAVTSRIPATPGTAAGVVGHPFRARVDFQSGRMTWCKVSGRAGEGGYRRNALVSVPRACGGG